MSKNLPYNKIDKNKLLLIGEAAVFLGVSIDTLRRWDKAGKIRSVRPDGKNRYFAISELKRLKESKPLSISEAAKKLGVSASTLRRYEAQDLINPKRNGGGERIYSQDTIDEFYRRKERIAQKRKIKEARFKQEVKPKLTPLTSQVKVRDKPIKAKREIRIVLPNLEGMRGVFRSFTAPKFSLSHVVVALFIVLTSSLSVRYLKDHAPEYKQQVYQTGEQVLGIADDARSFFSKVGGFFSKTTTNIAEITEQVAEQARVTFSGGRITDINQVFELDEEGNLVPKITLNITQPELLKITETKETRVIQNLDAETVQGRIPGELEGDLAVFAVGGRITALRVDTSNLLGGGISGGEGGLILDDSITADDLAVGSVSSSEIVNAAILAEDIADGAITSAKISSGAVGSGEIADGAITGTDIGSGAVGADEIASGAVNIEELADTLAFADGNFLDLSAILHNDTGLQGLRLPNVLSASPTAPVSGEGFLAYDTAGNQALIFDGSSWTQIGGGVTLYTTADGNSTTSSVSGLELLSDEISLIRGCSDTQVLKWNNTAKTWGCGDDSGAGGAGISTVQEDLVNVVTSATAINFTSDFSVIDAGAGKATVDFDYSGSGVTRKGQGESVSGVWTFTNGIIFNGNITANDASADTILIGQSGGTDDTVTIAGIISLTDDDWSIDSTGVTTGLSGITADTVAFSGVSAGTNANGLVIGTGGSLSTSGTGTITATDLVCTNCIGATEVADLTLGTDTAGNYVATLTSGSGVSATATGEGSTPTIALGNLTGNWSQAGAFDIVLGNAGSELQILESVGATYYGTIDVGDLGVNATYTFSGTTGTVLTDANYTGTLDSVYVNVGESPSTGDIAGSFTAGLTIGADKILESHLKAVDVAGDEECLTYETTTGDFEWQACGGGGGMSTVEENNVSVVTSAVSIDFLGADFAVTDAGGGEADIAIDYANSGITRDNQTETVSGAWTFSNLTVSDTTIDLSGGSTTFDLASAGDTTFAITNSGAGAGKFRVDGLVSCNTIDTDASGNFSCGTDEGGAGGGIATIKENNTNVVTSALVVDFLGADFAVTDAGSGEGDIAIDYTNSGITRKDQNEAITGDWGFTLAGTDSLDILSDLAGTVNVLAVTGTPSSTAGTAYGFYIDQADSANTNGLDAALVIDNSDIDLAIADGVLFVSAGGAITDAIDASDANIVNAINIGGNAIAGTNFSVTAGGTVTAADISCGSTTCITLGTETGGNYVASITNGSGIVGADGGSEGAGLTLALGDLIANWSQTGAFDIVLGNASSELQILESVGATYYGTLDVGDLGANATYTFAGATGSVLTDTNAATELSGWDQDSSNDLAVGTAETITGGWTFNTAVTTFTTGILANGGITTSGAGNLTLTADTTGDVVVTTDADTTFSVSNLTNCDTIDTDGSGVFSCGTDASGGGGAWSDLTVAGADLALSQGDWTTALSFNTASDVGDSFFVLDVTNDLVTDTTTQTLLSLVNTDDAIATGTLERLLYLNNADANEAVTDGIVIDSIGAGGITDAIDVSAANITNALNIGANNIVTGATTLASTELDILDAGILLSELTDTGTLTAGTVDINGGNIDGTILGATTPVAGTFTTLTGNTSITSVGAIAANGGITFDNATDTLGAFTAGGTIDLGNNTAVNLGAAGTDFSGTGGLTLADALSVSSGGVGVTAGGVSITAGALAVNSDSITSDGTLTIDGTSIVRLGDATNYFQVDEANGPSYAGTARPDKEINLYAEFSGATLTGDGTDNSGTMTSDNDGASTYRNYYNWTSATTGSDYDIWIKVPVPQDFAAWNGTGTATGYGTAATEDVVIEVFGTNDTTICSSDIVTAVGWNSDVTMCAYTGGTFTQGSYFTVRVTLRVNTASNEARIAEITLPYKARY